jgi:hypothetical protein
MIGAGAFTMRSAAERVGRQRRGWAVGLMAAAAICLSSAALADLKTFAPPSQNLRVQFPSNPTQREAAIAGTNIVEWTAADSGFFYLVQHGVHPGTVYQPEQLQTDLQDFVSEMQCTVTAQSSVAWPAPEGGTLPGLRVSFTMPDGTQGEAVWLIKDQEAFSALVIDQTKPGRTAQMDAFIGSLQVVK